MPAHPGVDITSPNTNTDLFTAAAEITVNLNLCNRNSAAATVRLHVVTAGGSPVPANAIEWAREIAPNGVYERWAITLGPNQKLVGRSSLAGVNCVTWGA